MTEIPTLTKREYEILSYIANGYQDKQIARKLYISTQTIKCHVHSIAIKLNTVNRTHSVAIAKDTGILPINTKERQE